MLVTRISPITGERNTFEVNCTEDNLLDLSRGIDVVLALPNATPEQREFVVRGVLPDEADKLYPEPSGERESRETMEELEELTGKELLKAYIDSMEGVLINKLERPLDDDDDHDTMVEKMMLEDIEDFMTDSELEQERIRNLVSNDRNMKDYIDRNGDMGISGFDDPNTPQDI